MDIGPAMPSNFNPSNSREFPDLTAKSDVVEVDSDSDENCWVVSGSKKSKKKKHKKEKKKKHKKDKKRWQFVKVPISIKKLSTKFSSQGPLANDFPAGCPEGKMCHSENVYNNILFHLELLIDRAYFATSEET